MEPLKKPLLCFYTLYHYINTRKEKSFESQSIEQMLKVILETNCSSVGDGGSGVEVHVRELPERNLRDSLNSISEESDLNKRLVVPRSREARLSRHTQERRAVCGGVRHEIAPFGLLVSVHFLLGCCILRCLLHRVVPSVFGLPPTVCPPMSFWKPGEAYPDKVAEEEMETEERIPLDNTPAQRTSEKVKLSDATKNLPVACVVEALLRSS